MPWQNGNLFQSNISYFTLACVVRKLHVSDPFEPGLRVVSKGLGEKPVRTLLRSVFLVDAEAKLVVNVGTFRWKKSGLLLLFQGLCTFENVIDRSGEYDAIQGHA